MIVIDEAHVSLYVDRDYESVPHDLKSKKCKREKNKQQMYTKVQTGITDLVQNNRET